jgi:murein DD-endopeptidase MepM/ murein hydrolase activator NlpD
MKHIFINKITVLILILLFCVLSLFCIYQHNVILDLIDSQQKWEIEKYNIIQELNKLNDHFNKFNEHLKKSGITSYYQSFLSIEHGSKASQVAENQYSFVFETLLLLNAEDFTKIVNNIVKSFNLRLSSFYKDSRALKRNGELILVNIPSLWPTEGKITSLFGKRKHPIKKRIKFHTGVDIANLLSTDVISTAAGLVIYSGYRGGYGNTIIIDHENGFETYYAHAKKLLVRKGDQVTRGTVIAKMGSTGLSTGSHVHYEIRFNGEPLDPVSFTN